jgi:hypothetical protein
MQATGVWAPCLCRWLRSMRGLGTEREWQASHAQLLIVTQMQRHVRAVSKEL